MPKKNTTRHLRLTATTKASNFASLLPDSPTKKEEKKIYEFPLKRKFCGKRENQARSLNLSSFFNPRRRRWPYAAAAASKSTKKMKKQGA